MIREIFDSIFSGESKKSKVRSSRRFFIRNNNKALRKRRQFLRSKETKGTLETEKSPSGRIYIFQ